MISRAGQLASSTRVLAAIGFVCVLAVAAIGAADGDFDGTGAGGLQAAPGAGACAATDRRAGRPALAASPPRA
jgi:hypothetical protein